MNREGQKYRSRQKLRVQCPECAADLEESFLVVHHNTQNIIDIGAQWDTHLLQGRLIHIVCPLCALWVRGITQSRGAREG